MLGDLSATPLPDTVTRLVQDAARRASGTLLVSAATVLIVSDPADLAAACAIKAIKLTKVSTTVAVSDVPAARVMAALERKGVVAQLITNQPAPTRTSDADAERAEREAARIRQQAQRLGGNAAMAKLADDMEQRARLLRDVDLRFAVPAAITLTPTMVERLAPR